MLQAFVAQRPYGHSRRRQRQRHARADLRAGDAGRGKQNQQPFSFHGNARDSQSGQQSQRIDKPTQLSRAGDSNSITNNSDLICANTGGPPDWVTAGNLDANISNGLLYPYLNNCNTYRCPSDSNQINDRTYSINCLLKPL